MNPLISVCIPVFNGAAFVRETLDAVLAQNHNNMEILISVDVSNDPSLEICASYARYSNVMVFNQPTRLGWTGNMNYLIRQTTGDFQCIIPHDDVIPNDYLSRLLDELRAHPGAVNAYPMIEGFGVETLELRQRSIRGDRLTRTLDVILNHHNAVSSIRGLTPRDLPPQAMFLDSGLPGHRCADTVQIMQHALCGELIELDSLRYRKRFHDASEHRNWQRSRLSVRIDSWAALCAALAVCAIEANEWEAKASILEASMQRLLGRAPARAFLSVQEFRSVGVIRRLTSKFVEHFYHRTKS